MKAYLTAWEREHGFASSLDEKGELRIFSTGGQRGIVKPTRNPQFPAWLEALPPAEKARMQAIGPALLEAMRFETAFTIETLKERGSLDAWVARGGSLKGTPYAHLVEED